MTEKLPNEKDQTEAALHQAVTKECERLGVKQLRLSAGSHSGRIYGISGNRVEDKYRIGIFVKQEKFCGLIDVSAEFDEVKYKISFDEFISGMDEVFKGCRCKWTVKRRRVTVDGKKIKYPQLIDFEIKLDGQWVRPFGNLGS